MSGATITAVAREISSCARCLRPPTKAIAPKPAASSGATWVTRSVPSPSSVAPTRSARSASRHPAAPATGLASGIARPRQGTGEIGLLVGKRLDDLVGDIDALACKDHGILQDQVELLNLGHLLNHLVRALLDAG